MPNPEKPARPEKPSKPGRDRRDSGGEGSSSTKTKMTREVTTVERSSSSKTVSKHDSTPEERSLIRKQRRETERQKKEEALRKAREEEEEDDDDEDEEEGAPATGLEGAKFDLSNQNNIVINNDNKAMEEMVKLMNKMYDDNQKAKGKGKEKKVERAEKKETKVERVEKKETKSVDKGKERKKVKDEEEVVEETTTTITKTKKKSLGERLAESKTKLSTIKQTFVNPQVGHDNHFVGGPGRDSHFRRGRADTTTITTTMLQQWIQEESHIPFPILFYEVLYMWGYDSIYVFAVLTVWAHDEIPDDQLAAVLCEILDGHRNSSAVTPGHNNDALKWFLTEVEESAEFLIWSKYVPIPGMLSWAETIEYMRRRDGESYWVDPCDTVNDDLLTWAVSDVRKTFDIPFCKYELSRAIDGGHLHLLVKDNSWKRRFPDLARYARMRGQ